MKNILGLGLTIIGAFIVQLGFNMLSPEVQNEFAKSMYDKVSAFLGA